MPKRKDRGKLAAFTNPSAKIPYNDYIRIITESGAIERKRSHSGGTKRSFTITVGDNTVPFVLHEPHSKKGHVRKWDHHNVLFIFKSLGLIEDEGEEDEEEKS